MKIYTKEEAERVWKKDQLFYAEKAHEYPCCDLPQYVRCCWCEDGVWCPVIMDYTPKRN